MVISVPNSCRSSGRVRTLDSPPLAGTTLGIPVLKARSDLMNRIGRLKSQLCEDACGSDGHEETLPGLWVSIATLRGCLRIHAFRGHFFLARPARSFNRNSARMPADPSAAGREAFTARGGLVSIATLRGCLRIRADNTPFYPSYGDGDVSIATLRGCLRIHRVEYRNSEYEEVIVSIATLRGCLRIPRWSTERGLCRAIMRFNRNSARMPADPPQFRSPNAYMLPDGSFNRNSARMPADPFAQE